MSDSRVPRPRPAPAARGPIAAAIAAAVAAALGTGGVAAAQPARAARPSLAELRDDQQLAEAVARIANDPAIPVADPASRAAAQALLVEGIRRLQARAYEQALANLLEAYGKVGSPQLLLEIAPVLRELGRPADAANTYQRYLDEPAAGGARAAEVGERLAQLDEQLTLLRVTVAPRGVALSIDGGPFVPVGQSLVTRVRPGPHLVRIRGGERTAELTIHGFEGETKRVDARVEGPPADPAALDQGDAWLTTGTQYSAAGGHARRTRSGFAGPEIAPVLPALPVDEAGGLAVRAPASPGVAAGALAVLRIDGKLRGFAGGLGLAVERGRFEADLMLLRSAVTGAYLGGRIRFGTGALRPYVAAGVPSFLYDDRGDTKLALGVRAAGGVEVRITRHLSLQGDLGYEHFFGVDDTGFEADVLVPTLGAIGRL